VPHLAPCAPGTASPLVLVSHIDPVASHLRITSFCHLRSSILSHLPHNAASSLHVSASCLTAQAICSSIHAVQSSHVQPALHECHTSLVPWLQVAASIWRGEASTGSVLIADLVDHGHGRACGRGGDARGSVGQAGRKGLAPQEVGQIARREQLEHLHDVVCHVLDLMIVRV
jgi:hypothetical protein